MVQKMMLVVGLLAAGTAFAGDDDDGPDVIYQPVTEIEMGGVDLEGTIVRPELKLSTERAKASFPSFIRLRAEWKQEMKQSVNDVK